MTISTILLEMTRGVLVTSPAKRPPKSPPFWNNAPKHPLSPVIRSGGNTLPLQPLKRLRPPQFSSEAPTIATDTAVWEAPAAPQAPEIPAATVLLWIWLGGVGVVLLVYLTLYAITARQLRRLPCATDSDTLRMFLRLKRELGIHGKVNLVTGGGGMLGGIWQPTVVIPAERHGEDLAPILVHEPAVPADDRRPLVQPGGVAVLPPDAP